MSVKEFDESKDITKTPMKKTFLLLMSLLVSVSLACADSPFTSKSDGTDWNSASSEYKMEYSRQQAKAESGIAPNITASIIYDSLEAFYKSNDSQILSQPICQMVALTVAQIAKQQ